MVGPCSVVARMRRPVGTGAGECGQCAGHAGECCRFTAPEHAAKRRRLVRRCSHIGYRRPELCSETRSSAATQTKDEEEHWGTGIEFVYNLFKSYAKHCYVRGDNRLPLIEYARLCVQGQKEHKRNTMSSAVKGDRSTRLKRVSEKLRHDWEALAPHLKQEYKRACAIALEERSRAL